MLVFVLVSILASTGVLASNLNNVVDNLDYLSESEENELQSRIDTIKENYTLDTVIVITDNTDGKSSMEFADDYYDYNGYGLDSEYSGLLMLINMQDREVFISTVGKAIDIYSDSRISNMVDNVTGFLSNANYNDACNKFLDDVIRYVNYGVPEGQYRVEGDPYSTLDSRRHSNLSYFGKASLLMRSWPVYIIALIIAIITTAIVSFSSKGKVTIHSRTYEESGSFVLTENTDLFIRESTTRIKIERNSGGGGGGSSTHRSSSGRSHGGGGGRF